MATSDRWLVALESGALLLFDGQAEADGRIVLRPVTRAELSRLSPKLYAFLTRSDHMDTPRVVTERRR
jgi:hypothetical protein